METKTVKKGGVVNVLRALVAAYLVTGILLLLLALLLYKLDLDESKISMGIIAIYILSSFLGGILAGKGCESRKFLWGLMTGSLYFLVLFLFSLILKRPVQMSAVSLVTTCLMCMGGGMAGGMIS